MDRTPETCCIEARFSDAETAERAAAEAWEVGVLGIEERTELGDTLLLLYAPVARAGAVRAAVARAGPAVVGEPVPVVARDWSQAWREGLEAIRVGERLVVRPSWIEVAPTPGRVELVIDPGQAFGTGGHVSTRLALEWIEACSRADDGLGPDARVLDAGAGTGVLALAALALGAGSAVAFDLDPLAGKAAREWALRNGLASRLQLFVGPVNALAAPPFDWVLANLLKRELLPIAPSLARCTRRGGRAIFSGLLAADEAEVLGALGDAGFGCARRRTDTDANGDEWISLLMARE
jgi:ribosomal protein L11 methyltransferase